MIDEGDIRINQLTRHIIIKVRYGTNVLVCVVVGFVGGSTMGRVIGMGCDW